MRKLLVIEHKRGPEWIVDEGGRNFRAFHDASGAYHTINRRGTFRQTCLGLVGGKLSKLITPTLNPGEFHPRVWRPHSYPVMRELFQTGWLSAMHAARSLMANMTDVFRYVEPHPNNLKVFAHQIRQLLILACTEVETQCKAILRANGYVKLDTNGTPAVHKSGKLKGEPKDWNMQDFMKVRQGARLDDWTVQLVGYPSMPRTRPFAAWKTGKSPAWYRAYNNVKHDRELHFEHATLGHLVEALGAVHILIVGQFGKYGVQGISYSEPYHFDEQPPIFPLKDLYVPPQAGRTTWRQRPLCF